MEILEAEMLTAACPRLETLSGVAVPDIVRRIGHTPLIRLQRITEGLPDKVALYAKAEHLNPSGSVKDRAARAMVLEGLRSGALRGSKTLIDATSGNTGIAYAMLGAAFGFPVALAMPANASPERKQILKTYGVELILTDPMEGTDGAQDEVRRLVERRPERYFYPDQYNNDANWQAHYDGTGKEILDQTRGRVTHFVTGLGTTGTFVGTTRRLKDFAPHIRCIAVQPDSPLHGLEGLKHLETARVPGIFDETLLDEDRRCSTEVAYATARRLAREEGIFVGPSAAANVAAAMNVAQELEQGIVVTILCDTGARYLSEPFWQE